MPPLQPSYLPSLTALANEPALTYSTTVVTGPEAACHFDLSDGTSYGPIVPKGEIPPGNPVPFNAAGSSIHVASLTAPDKILGTIEGLDNKTVVVSNECHHKPDCTAWGFLLHYLTCGAIPTVPLPATADDASGPGCSNSQFP